jgi:hypothetical protein
MSGTQKFLLILVAGAAIFANTMLDKHYKAEIERARIDAAQQNEAAWVILAQQINTITAAALENERAMLRFVRRALGEE